MRFRCSIGLALLAALLFVPAAYAQSVAVAQLSGVVTDESGGVLPGVGVTVTQTNTGMTRFVTTGERGDFVFTNLPIGPYRLSAKLEGFKAFEQTGINLNVGDTRSANVVMGLGVMTETVSVQADASLVETRSLTIGTITPRRAARRPAAQRPERHAAHSAVGRRRGGRRDGRPPAGRRGGDRGRRRVGHQHAVPG